MFKNGSPAAVVSDAPVPSRSNPALQNADTAWNIAIHTPRRPYLGQNQNSSASAPLPSHTAVTSSALRVRRTTPPICRAPTVSIKTVRRCRPMRRPSKMETRMDTVIKLNPPTWISRSRIACPKSVNCVQVSYSTSPVTQEAEAEVNSASRNGSVRPDREEMGSIRKNAPSRIKQAKLSARF